MSRLSRALQANQEMQYIVISNPWQHKEENTSNVDSNTYSVGSWDEDNMSVVASQSTVQR